jgi:elongation factor 1-beta
MVVFMVVRLLPSDADADIGSILESVSKNLPEGVRVGDSRVEEIGFGVRALIVGFILPESEGVGEKLENCLSTLQDVEYEVVSVTRV